MDNTTTQLSFTGDILSKKKIVKAWKSLTKKPFPYGKMTACVLESEEVDKAWEILRNSPNIRNCSVQEYGRELPLDKKTTAVTFITTHGEESNGWAIIIRKDSPIGAKEELKHELSHIINGDITLDGKAFGQTIK